MDPRITFTRASTATFTGQNGRIQSAAINAPRFDYNPTTLAPLGLLIEEQRANLLPRSEEFDNAAWGKSGAATITANTAVSPDGTVNADLLNGTSPSDYVSQVPSYTSGILYTHSCFVKAGVGSVVTLRGSGAVFGSEILVNYNLLTGVATVAGGSPSGFNAINVGNGWWRCWFQATASATASAQFQIRPSTGSILLYGAQLEVGAFPTSYIPTVASQVTRAADVAVMTGTNFSDWYNATEGTFFVNGLTNRPYSGSTGGQFLSPAANAANRMWIAQGTTTNFVNVNGQSSGSTQWDFSVGGAPVANQQTRAALAYATNNIAASANGSAVGTDTSAVIPTVTQLTIGIGVTLSAASTINGHIRQIVYYPRRLSNSELQGLTS